MHFRGLLLLCAAILAICGASPASATMRIYEDRGGQIGYYLEAFARLRSSGERVVVDGNCFSACTLLLGAIPRNRFCATARARFGFHAAWMPDGDGRPVTSPMGTQALWNAYPPSVRHWIIRHGGLSHHMIYLQGHELAGMVPSCSNPGRAVKVRAVRHHLPGHPRYERAAAASDRP